MRPDELQRLLEETGAWQRGHFLLTTGLHSPEFFLLSQAFQYPDLAERCGRALAAALVEAAGGPAGVVVGPAMGGVLLAHEVARSLGARAMFAEKDETGAMRLRRGFRLAPGERVFVVEDAVTTGGSALKAAAAVREAGGQVAAVGAVVDRSGGRASFDVPFTALLRVDVPAYAPDACPLCAAGVPLTRPKA